MAESWKEFEMKWRTYWSIDGPRPFPAFLMTQSTVDSSVCFQPQRSDSKSQTNPVGTGGFDVVGAGVVIPGIESTGILMQLVRLSLNSKPSSLKIQNSLFVVPDEQTPLASQLTQ